MNIYKSGKLSVLMTCILLINHVSMQATSKQSIYYLEPGDSKENSIPGLCIFCYTAKSKYLTYFWRALIVISSDRVKTTNSRLLEINTNTDNYDLYHGKSPTEVIKKHDVHQRSWKFNWFGTKKREHFKIDPFEDTCIGIYTHSYDYHYKISMILIKINVNQVLITIAGILLFWSSPMLSRSPVFYYLTGIFLGVVFSILILVWFAAKLFSQGKATYLIAGTGWIMSTWLAHIFLENVQLIFLQHKKYVFGYLLLSSLISFLVCYRIGPVTNIRTKRISQWLFQVFGLIMIYFSSYFKEASLGLCILCIFIYNFPVIMYYKSRNFWRSMFPKRQKLLTDNEYRKQGIVETEKALKNLKQYCSSPESNPWSTILRLKDPVRFAKFMEGDSHLSEDESMQHDQEIVKLIEECEYTDDEYEVN